MNKDEMLQTWEQRKTAYANQWRTGLSSACCSDPVCCCLSLFCPYCASYSLRKRAIYNNMDSYLCCGGFLPCSGRCGESSCPEVCLCLEVCCCFGTSVAVTRWMIQDELRIQNGACDNCILATMLFLQQLACICQLAACITGDDTLGQIADLISFIADLVWWTVCACMQTQHKVQLDERDLTGAGAGAMASNQPPLPPPMQAQYAQPAAYSGAVAYPPVQGQPGMYGGPPQYPPPGYPPMQQQPPYGQQMYH